MKFRPVLPRLRAETVAGLAVTLLPIALLAAGCTVDASPSVSMSASPPTRTARPTPIPTWPPTPTPQPTPRFTNPPDPELAALFPATVGGLPLVVAPVEEFALTPGDVGLAYGEMGVRFASLAIAYMDEPRLTLYAMRVEGPPVSTEDLEPHLATAGRYVGIAGLHRDPWQLVDAAGHMVWMRPEDRATAVGTRIYTWSSGEFVFLLIGVDDALNRALIASLPGEEPPSPAPAPTSSQPSSSQPTD